METFAAHGSQIMKISSEDDPTPRSATKSRWPLTVTAVCVLIVSIALSVSWSNQHTLSNWKRYQAEIAARGDSVDWRDYVQPPAPPDDKNFGATPLLQSIGRKGKVDPKVWARIDGTGLSEQYGRNQLGKTGDWTTGQGADLQSIQDFLRSAKFALSPMPQEPAADVLAALDGLTADFDELREASKRPFARLKLAHPDPLNCDVPEFNAVWTLSHLLSLRTSAELALGRADGAFADVRVIHRLADVNRTEPSSSSGGYYCVIHGLALQAFWEGWVAGQWSDQQLKEFQSRFASVDMLAVFDNAMRGERAGINSMVETLNGRQLLDHFLPAGAVCVDDWNDRLIRFYVRNSSPALRAENLLFYNRLWDQTFFKSYDLSRHQVFPAKSEAAMVLIEKSFSKITAEKYLALIAVSNFPHFIKMIARNQIFVSEALIVCALERYRRENGEYPATLARLSPGFLENLPHDIITGETLKYRLTANGQFLLYSVGWNQRDDNGNAEKDKGDWVWPVEVSK